MTYKHVQKLFGKYIMDKWQEPWYSTRNNTLGEIKHTVHSCTSSKRPNSSEEMALSRLRIGHTRLKYLLFMARLNGAISTTSNND